MPFCTTKTSNFLVNQTLFLWRNCLCAYHKFCFLCSCYLLTPLIFTLLAATISHFFTASMKFSCFFFQRNSSPWCSFTRSSSFSVIHMSVHIKNNVEKNTTFFFSKSPGHSKLNLELHLGYHTCWLSYFFIVGVPVVRTDGRSGGRTVTWLPKFLGCIGYQIFSPMVLRARESSAINAEIHGAERKLDDVSSTCGPTSHACCG